MAGRSTKARWRLQSPQSALLCPERTQPLLIRHEEKDLVFAKDGSLTIYVHADAQRANWLPAPKADFTLYLRAYWPRVEVIDGSWTQPPGGETEVINQCIPLTRKHQRN